MYNVNRNIFEYESSSVNIGKNSFVIGVNSVR